METVVQALQAFASLGPMVMMPIIILILGLIFRIKMNVLVKSALMVGVGFPCRRNCVRGLRCQRSDACNQAYPHGHG